MLATALFLDIRSFCWVTVGINTDHNLLHSVWFKDTAQKVASLWRHRPLLPSADAVDWVDPDEEKKTHQLSCRSALITRLEICLCRN